jgi:hypothetical protein
VYKGEAVSLKDAAARCLAARLAQCQEEKDPSAADELARLPEELRLLVQNKSIRHFQVAHSLTQFQYEDWALIEWCVCVCGFMGGQKQI